MIIVHFASRGAEGPEVPAPGGGGSPKNKGEKGDERKDGNRIRCGIRCFPCLPLGPISDGREIRFEPLLARPCMAGQGLPLAGTPRILRDFASRSTWPRV